LKDSSTKEAIVASSLKNGFFHIPRAADEAGDPVGRAVGFLMDRNDRRFWRLLQQGFSAGECERALQLLEAYARSFLRRRQYPPAFGARLLRLVCALPPAIRRLKLEYPLLDLGRCVKLVRLASPSDFADVPVLFDAVRGKTPGDDRFPLEQDSPLPSTETDCGLFDAVTAEIREPVLARRFDIPIDSARASFVRVISASLHEVGFFWWYCQLWPGYFA